MSKEFRRQDGMRWSKLGKGRKKLQKWRRPHGTHSKMRRRRKNYPKVVSIGYSTNKSQAGLVNGLQTIVVHNQRELLAVGKNNGVILAKVGAKKKIELLKIAQEKNIQILNHQGRKQK